MLAVVSTTINTPHWHASQCNGRRCKQVSKQAERPCHVRDGVLGKVSGHPSSSPPTSLTSFAAPGRRFKQDSEQVEHPCHVHDVGTGNVSSHPVIITPPSLTMFAAPGRGCTPDSKWDERPHHVCHVDAGEWWAGHLLEFVTLMLVYSCEYKMISKYD